jgi:hypothetical protein
MNFLIFIFYTVFSYSTRPGTVLVLHSVTGCITTLLSEETNSGWGCLFCVINEFHRESTELGPIEASFQGGLLFDEVPFASVLEIN